MSRALCVTIWCVTLAILARTVIAQPPVSLGDAVIVASPIPPVTPTPPLPTPTPLVLSKDASGVISPLRVSLVLTSNTSSDETAKLIPNGSKLEATGVSYVVNSKGVGIFSATANIVSPAGTILLTGMLHGVIDLTSKRASGVSDAAPGHLEGTFDAVLPVALTPDFVLDTPLFPLQLSFSADMGKLALPQPTYTVHLDGLIGVRPPQPRPTPTPVPSPKPTPTDTPEPTANPESG